MKLVNSDALKHEIKSNTDFQYRADLGPWNVQEVVKLIDNFPGVTKFNVNANDVIVFKFHNNTDCEELEFIRNKLKQMFPYNEVVGVMDDIELNTQHPEDVIEYLENMIKKLKGGVYG